MCPQSGPSVIAILDVRQELLSADCKVTGSRRACNRRTVVVVTVVVVAVAVGVVVVVVALVAEAAERRSSRVACPARTSTLSQPWRPCRAARCSR